jgi:hypothetical protein
MTDGPEKKLVEAIERGDGEEMLRLMPTLEAMIRKRAEGGDVGAARLLYDHGHRIDPALCGFAPGPRTRFAAPPRTVRRRSGLAEIVLLRGVFLFFLFGWSWALSEIAQPLFRRTRGGAVISVESLTPILLLSIPVAVTGIFALVRPIRQASLIRRGAIVEGTIEEISTSSRNSVQRARFSYRAPAHPKMVATTWGPPPKRPLQVGDHVTVFYNPRSPRRAVAYECCDFETNRLAY